MNKDLKENLSLLGVGLIGGLIGAALMMWLNGGISLNAGTTSLSASQNLVVKEDSAIVSVVGKVSPSVVSITSTQQVQSFFGRVLQSQSGGTGFIVSSSGLIVTNKHVVSGQTSNLKVTTADGKDYDARVVATDPLNDVALIKISAENLPVVEFGDNSKMAVGQKVVAIGNALGQFQNTVTVGVVSAVGRVISASDSQGQPETIEGVIQTDASINPGNSGGPLINLAGQVIGVNTAVAAQGQALGFALPIEIARTALESYLKHGSIERPFLGVNYVSISSELAARQDLPVNYGALIVAGQNGSAVAQGSPAAKAGLKEGDIILEVDGRKIEKGQGLVTQLQKHSPGDEVALKVRREGRTFDVRVELGKIA